MHLVHLQKVEMGTKMSKTIRVLIVNDHQVERRGLVTLLQSFNDLILAGVARTGAQALQLCQSAKPDVVLMDLLMPGMDGVETTRLIHERHPGIHVIILTNWEEYDMVQRALTLGAETYLLKNMSGVQLAEAVRTAHHGQPQISLPLPDLGADLTTRELEVLIYVAQGMTNAQIAIHLTISRATVKYYVSSILGKMGSSSRTGAVALAVKHGLITVPDEE